MYIDNVPLLTWNANLEMHAPPSLICEIPLSLKAKRFTVSLDNKMSINKCDDNHNLRSKLLQISITVKSKYYKRNLIFYHRSYLQITLGRDASYSYSYR